MKKITLISIAVITAATAFAQWQSVPITGNNSDVTSMFTYVETLMVGTAGDGIFKTEDSGDTWTDISGDLGNLFVNDIRGGGGPEIIWVATQNGPYFTMDHQNYANYTSTGLTNTDILYYWFGDDNSTTAQWAIGTNGGGVFVSAEMSGPWNASATGMSGNGMIVNDITGYADDEVNYIVAATNGGVYFSMDSLSTWTENSGGLAGDALTVTGVAALGTVVLITTHNGIYYSLDFGDNWIPVIPSGKFNALLVQPSLSGISIFAVGEEAYYSPDFTSFFQLDLSGITGEITCVAQNSTYAFMGTTSDGKNPEKAGGIFRKPLDQLITGVPDYLISGSDPGLLQQNYPNPVANQTTIPFKLNEPGNVILQVYDPLGRNVKTLVNDYRKSGSHYEILSVEGLPKGIYYYTLEVNGVLIGSRKMMIINKR